MQNRIAEILPDLTDIRRHLHAHPELSGEEYKTADLVEKILKDKTDSKVDRIADTAVIARFDSGKEGPVVMLRADTDALAIDEELDIDHRSQMQGISHKCGHDGHTSIMLGVARILNESSIKKGSAYLLWQPAEEKGIGARAVLEDPYFDDLHIDQVFALHNLPGYPKGQIALKSGSFTSHVESLIIHLKGRTAHAAEPEHGINPSIIVPRILQDAEALTWNRPEDEQDFFLITPVYLRIGSPDHGIAAGDAELHFTIRAWTTDFFKEKCDNFMDNVRSHAADNGLKLDFEWTEQFYANQNNEESTELLKKVCKKEGLDYQVLSHGNKWGEDFGLFTQRYKGAMFGIGSGEDCPALHHPDYDFPDEIMPEAIRLFSALTLQILNR